jgi:hypothetical protein
MGTMEITEINTRQLSLLGTKELTALLNIFKGVSNPKAKKVVSQLASELKTRKNESSEIDEKFNLRNFLKGALRTAKKIGGIVLDVMDSPEFQAAYALYVDNPNDPRALKKAQRYANSQLSGSPLTGFEQTQNEVTAQDKVAALAAIGGAAALAKRLSRKGRADAAEKKLKKQKEKEEDKERLAKAKKELRNKKLKKRLDKANDSLRKANTPAQKADAKERITKIKKSMQEKRIIHACSIVLGEDFEEDFIYEDVDFNTPSAIKKAYSLYERTLKVIAQVELWNGKKMKKSFKNQSSAERFIKKLQDTEDVRGYNLYAEDKTIAEIEWDPINNKYMGAGSDWMNEMINEKQLAGLKKKSDESGIAYGILKKVFDRGMAAWKTGHRPGATPHQWAYARVNSFITGGKTRTTADADLWAKHKGKKESIDESSAALRKLKISNKLSSAEYQKFKKLKAFNSKDWKWNSKEGLYHRVNEEADLEEAVKWWTVTITKKSGKLFKGQTVDVKARNSAEAIKKGIKQMKGNPTLVPSDSVDAVLGESTLNYARTLKAIEKDRKTKSISKKDKETLAKIADLMKKLKEEKSCPTATQDLEVNTQNRDATIEKFNYGPLNVDEPGSYWKNIAKYWKTTEEAAKKSLCENCVAFDISPRMKDCMPGETSDDEGELGYCWMHHFKCHSKRTCHTWAKGGPIVNDETSLEWEQKSQD